MKTNYLDPNLICANLKLYSLQQSSVIYNKKTANHFFFALNWILISSYQRTTDDLCVNLCRSFTHQWSRSEREVWVEFSLWKVSDADSIISDLLVLLMTVQQKRGESALPVVVTVALYVSFEGRSSADDWEGGSLGKIYICSQITMTITTADSSLTWYITAPCSVSWTIFKTLAGMFKKKRVGS